LHVLVLLLRRTMTTKRVSIEIDNGQTVVTDEQDARSMVQDFLNAGYPAMVPTIYEVEEDHLTRLRRAEREYRSALAELRSGEVLVEHGEWTQAPLTARAQRAFDNIVASHEDGDGFYETESDCLDAMERSSLPSDNHFDFEQVKALVYAALEANGYYFDEKNGLTR
jgi:hypothetical protein